MLLIPQEAVEEEEHIEGTETWAAEEWVDQHQAGVQPHGAYQTHHTQD